MTRRAAACAAAQRCLAWSASAAGMVLFAAGVWAQAPVMRHRIEQYVASNQRQIVGELAELLAIPNIASDGENIRRNAVHLRSTLARRGFKAELLETAGNPLVYGRLDVPGAARTLLIYMHYDGQPVDAKFWKQASPFTPVLRAGRIEDGAKDLGAVKTQPTFADDWRIYGRSASDDKAPIIALCAALDALKAAGLSPTSNLRVIIDGEEESGSPSLVPAIARYRDKLTADLMLIFDGPVHPSMRPTIVFGARGALAMELTVYGPKFGVHSGHYGNWVPNPGIRLARLLASMKDEDGKVAIAGFYDGLAPLTAEEQAMLEAVPDEPARLLRLFGIAEPERRDLSLQNALQLPSLNVRGLSSAYVGAEARTIIPDRAIAALDIRLVKETPAPIIAKKVLAHIRAQGFHVLESEPDDETRARHPQIVKVVMRGATNAYRTSPLLPESKHVVDAVTKMWEAQPVQLRTSGGTVPIGPFIEAMGFPALGVPIVNFDNNQHAENENLRLGHFFSGIVTIAAVLVM